MQDMTNYPQQAMDQPIDIREDLEKGPARLVGVQDLKDGRIRYDYELYNGLQVFLVLDAEERAPRSFDNSTTHGFHEYRLMFLGEDYETEAFLTECEENDRWLLIGLARIDYEPDGQTYETMLDVQSRSQCNELGSRFAPVDFASLDSFYDDLTNAYIDYDQCNWNHLINFWSYNMPPFDPTTGASRGLTL